MALHLHRAEQADTLAGALADLLSEPLGDPFAVELVAVPARGVERWLRQRLAHRLGVDPASGLADGVSLNIEMPSPTTVFADVLSAVSGVAADEDPWRSAALPWWLLQTLDECADQPWADVVATHLGYRDSSLTVGESGHELELRQRRRFAVAIRLATLFGRYAAERPWMLTSWLAGDSVDGAGAALLPEHQWQLHLYRELAERIPLPEPARRLDETLVALRSTPEIAGLPERVSLFGPTRLNSAEIRLLSGLAEHRDVHVWLPHPSPAAWVSLAGLAVAPGTPAHRAGGTAADLIRNPLLRSLGRDSQELQQRLAQTVPDAIDRHHDPARTTPGEPADPDLDLTNPADGQPALRVLQQAVRNDTPRPAAAQRAVVAAGDRSVQVHSCHGRARQVEVLRDVIVGLLADDPTLQPRDILIMCPDIEAFASLLLGVFGACDLPEAHPGQRLRLRLADRSLRQTNPMLDVVARLLELAAGRVTAADVLDLVSLAPVKQRFRFSDDQLEELQRWVQASNIRWGLTVSDRAAFGLDTIADNTWHRGLDSWLLGIAMDPDNHRGQLPGWPLDGIESAQVETVGRFTEFFHRLAHCLRRLDGVHPLSHWIESLKQGLAELTAVERDTEWQRLQANRVLTTALHAGSDHDLRLRRSDLIELLSDELRGRPTRSNFRSGALTACSMVPMRSVPHRVVCLLGVDDGDIPRAAATDGDDVLAVSPLVGERDVASEDRHLLLDAVLAAREHLVICFSGADERTGARRPPAVPLGEILDDLDARLQPAGADGPPSRGAGLVVEHPLQPFDPRNFDPADPHRSFDRAALAGARAAGARPQTPTRRRFLARPLPAVDEPDVELSDLVEFYRHPVRAFLKRRLGLNLRDFTTDLETELAIDLDGLQQWAVGDRLLTAQLAGATADQARVAEQRLGALPPAYLGETLLAQAERSVEKVLRASAADRAQPSAVRDVAVALPGGGALTGMLTGLHGDLLVGTQLAWVKASNRLELWIKLLALTASSGRSGWQGRLRGKGGSIRQDAPDPDEATRLLADLVAGYRVGLREPLPLPPTTADVYAARRRRDKPADQDALTQWEGHPYKKGPRENRDPEYQLVFDRDWGRLRGARQLSDLTWPVTAAGERDWFGQIARTVFDPLARYERTLG